MNVVCTDPAFIRFAVAMKLTIGLPASEKSLGFENLARFGPQASGARAEARTRKTSAGEGELSPDEQRQVDLLKKTDRDVRAHEQAHIAVGADLIRGGPSFTYEIGPDKRRYAVAGEVSIDTSPGRTAEETIPKAQHIQATALAPADPSAQDYRVAATASRMESGARVELAAQRAEGGARETGEEAAFYRRVESAGAQPALSDPGARRLDLFV